jgi:DNA repair exonuclease SbcCD nuclease subunit
MENLFKRAAVITDLHFGKKSNDRQHNSDCEFFVQWFVKTAKEHNVDCIISCGDWHDNRQSVHVSTLNYSLSNMELLGSLGLPVYFITGNHDLTYREKREIHSVAIGRNIKNITIVNDFLYTGNVTFCPWLVGNEWKLIPEYAKKSMYMFGHFELPRFLMNAMVEMPDNDGLKHEHFKDLKGWAFSGHFHKRQTKGKVCYIGNAFPHNFSDAWDDDRGMMILDWGQEPEFIAWPNAPTYKTLNISELLENPEIYINSLTNAKIATDIDITYEEAQFIKEIFEVHYTPRKLDIISSGRREENQEFSEDVEFQSVDQIVIEGLKNIDSVSIDKALLIEIYQGLN